jgi:hypothetical protein
MGNERSVYVRWMELLYTMALKLGADVGYYQGSETQGF